jgi:hypothetical protein
MNEEQVLCYEVSNSQADKVIHNQNAFVLSDMIAIDLMLDQRGRIYFVAVEPIFGLPELQYSSYKCIMRERPTHRIRITKRLATEKGHLIHVPSIRSSFHHGSSKEPS